jgi:DNA-binding transcriptional MerR regulator
VRIGELARKTGVSIHTLRYYEQCGLLNEEHLHRSDSGYRHYADAALERLKLIKDAQDAGFTLREIFMLVEQWDNNALTDEDIRSYVEKKLEEVASKIARLEQIRAFLQQKLCRIQGTLTESR